jgi:hypothetical protein
MNAWEFHKDLDTAKSYQGFTCYRDLGPGRSLEDAYQVYKHQDSIKTVPGFFREWSWKGQWVDRVLAFDLETDRIQLETMRLERTEDHDQAIEDVRKVIHATSMNNLMSSAIVAKMVRSRIERMQRDTREVVDGVEQYNLSIQDVKLLALLIDCKNKDVSSIALALDHADQAIGIRQLQERLAAQ